MIVLHFLRSAGFAGLGCIGFEANNVLGSPGLGFAAGGRMQSAEVRLKDYLVVYQFKIELLGSTIMLQLLNPIQMIYCLSS